MLFRSYLSHPRVKPELIEFFEDLFYSEAWLFRVKDEAQLDASTAISGSGPAYFAYFAKSLIQTAQNLGFSSKEATRLVLFTLHGTSRLLEKTSLDPKSLLEHVASQKGTTQAALDKWDSLDFTGMVEKGVEQALNRAKEINNEQS